MGGIEDSIVGALRSSGLIRSVLPVHVPCTVLWPAASALAQTPLQNSRQQVLIAVRRRVVYRRLVVAAQLTGLTSAWVGVLLGKGRTVTLIGLGIALVGAVLALIDKDRLSAIDSRIERLLDEHRAASLEWLLMFLEMEPYSYGSTVAAGVCKVRVLQDRQGYLTGEVVDSLGAWLTSDCTTELPSQRWGQLQDVLKGLHGVDKLGRSWEHKSLVLLDSLRVGLLAFLIIIAISIPTLTLPDAVMATLATLITLSARSATDGALTIFTRPTAPPPTLSATDSPAGVLGRVSNMAALSDLDAATLELVLRSTVVVPRGLSKRRTFAVVRRSLTS